MTFIKICGLRTVEHALVAIEAGADLLGFIFAPSRRYVDPETVAAISAAARACGQPVQLVGVFVNETPERMQAIAAQCDLDILQLSGHEPASIYAALPHRQLIKTIRFDGSAAENSWLDQPARANLLLHVDAHVAGSYGGSGVLGDWDRAATLATQAQLLLAGGLTPENVGAAISAVRPWGVDVSSGVESAGIKDSAKIRAFIAAVRATDWQLARVPVPAP